MSRPMGGAYRFGLGAEWQVSKAVSLGAAVKLLWGGDMPVTQESAHRGRVSGSFADSWFGFLASNLRWQF